jgi:hypothetical protein
LAGVALGALLTTAATWLQRRSRERQDRRQEMLAAADDLRAGASATRMIMDAYKRAGARREELLAWTPLVSAQLERVHRANEVIIRLCDPAVAEAALALDTVSSRLARGENVIPPEWRDAMEQFSAAVRAVGYSR